MTRSAILGVGSHVPSQVVTNHDLARIMDTSDEWIVQRTGIRERRYVDHDGIGASDLAVPACRQALDRAGVAAAEIDAIIFATLSPDYFFPGSGCLLQHKLGLGEVPALDVRNQCAGFLYGLGIADAWVRSGMYSRVLLVGSEVQSTGLDYSDRGRDVTVLFGDGAGAAVIGRAPDDARGVLSVCLHSDGSQAQELWIEAPASCHSPRLSHQMIDEGRHYPRMNGSRVFRWAVDKMPAVALEALEQAGLTLDQVDLLVCHQANQRISELVASRIGIAPEKVVHNIAEYGNTTAATIPMALDRARREGRLGPGTVALLTTFGSGFVWGGAVVRF
jgi:3-oxoacyl-[acyl-carrier-protein] synthase-3